MRSVVVNGWQTTCPAACWVGEWATDQGTDRGMEGRTDEQKFASVTSTYRPFCVVIHKPVIDFTA